MLTAEIISERRCRNIGRGSWLIKNNDPTATDVVVGFGADVLILF